MDGSLLATDLCGEHGAHPQARVAPCWARRSHSPRTNRESAAATTLEVDESELRRVAPDSGEVLETLKMPAGMHVSGLESDGAGLFYCGGGGTAKVRAVRRPRRA